MSAEIPLPAGFSLIREIAVQCGSFGVSQIRVDRGSVMSEPEVAPIILADVSGVVLSVGSG